MNVDNLNTYEKKVLSDKLNTIHQGMPLQIYFPESYGLEPIETYGAPPPIGTRIAARSGKLKPHPRYKYELNIDGCWRVTDVIYCMTAPGDDKERFIYDVETRVEVYVEWTTKP